MGIAKRIFRHGWLIAFIIIIVIGYSQRERLFPGPVEPAEEQAVKTVAVEEPQAQVAALPTGEDQPSGSAQGSADAAGKADRADGGSHQAPSKNPDSGPGVDSSPLSSRSAPANEEYRGSLAAKPGNRQWGRPPVHVTESRADEFVTKINQARESFWSGDYARAIQWYRELIRQRDADPDLYGELGNVYYAQGQWSEAAEAYYQAAERLLRRGQISRATYLKRVIRGLDPEKAKQLDRAFAKTRARYR